MLLNRRILIAAVVAVLATAAQADTLYVDADNCPGPGSGTQADPYCSIQTAIDNAVNTDEIIVAPGTYQETVDFLGKAIALRSSDGAGVTIIDAQGTGSVVTCTSGEGADTILQGFTVTGGSATRGGGMHIDASSPTVTNCTFSENSADQYGGGMYSISSSSTVTDCRYTKNSAVIGGGLAGLYDSLTLNNCSIIRNVADTGGGVAFWYDANAVLDRCTFLENTADLAGGGVGGLESDITMIDCILSGNSSDVAGAILTDKCVVSLDRCTVTGNFAGSFGGGAYFSASNPVEMTNSIVSYNVSSNGGGVWIGGYSPTNIVNCTFVGNNGHGLGTDEPPTTVVATNSIFWGNTPAQIVFWAGSPSVFHCDLEGGWAGPGSNNISADPQFAEDQSGTWTADPVYDGPTDLTVLTDGSASFPPHGLVGRMIIPDTSISVLQTYVASNTATTITVVGEVWSALVNYGDAYLIHENHLTADSPCIDAGDNSALPEDITTDLDGNPRFLDIPETPDTGNGDLPIVDMGAYESLGGGCLAVTSQEVICHGDGSTFTVNVEGLNACTGGSTMVTFTGSGGAVGEDFCATLLVNTEQGGFCCTTQVCVPVPDCSPVAQPCDLDGDGTVGVLDCLALLSAWGPNPGHPADLDGDGTVGITDFLILLSNWAG
ncbi:MAG: right-handed parallel beta-helix repeat-containing protein [Planctomycetota bacterium]|jgi:hypothetical protein